MPYLSAQEYIGTITGVIQLEGALITGAKVIASSDSVSSYEGVGVTNSDGYFSINEAPLGGIKILVYSETDILIGRGFVTLNTSLVGTPVQIIQILP